MKDTRDIIKSSLAKAISYTAYRELVSRLALEGGSTGSEQTESLSNYTQLNDRRMKRWDKTLKFSDESIENISKTDKKITWLVLAESWCGDASPAIPVMNKISQINPSINLKIVLRDENLDLMNCFLTNKAMSIPKLIAIDEQKGEVVGEWGPRSQNATKLVEDYKQLHGALSPDFKEELQVWYNKDKGQSILKDLTVLLLK